MLTLHTNPKIHPFQEQLNQEHSKLMRTMSNNRVLNKFVPAIWALGTPIATDTKCPTACTNGYNWWVNPRFWGELTDAQKVGLALHEACHCMRLHPLRFKSADRPDLANIATDYSINKMIRELMKLTNEIDLPPDGVDESLGNYGEEAEEVIYNDLVRKEMEEPPPSDPPGGGGPCEDGEESEDEGEKEGGKENGGDGEDEGEKEGGKENGGGGEDEGEDEGETTTGGWSPGDFFHEDPPPQGDGGEEREQEQEENEGGGQSHDQPSVDQRSFEEKWTEISNAVEQACKLSGLGGEAFVEQLGEGRAGLPWKDMLRDFYKSLAMDEVSEEKYDRRFMADGIYVETFDRPTMKTAVVARDVSFSVPSQTVADISAEAQLAMQEVGIEKVIFIDFSHVIGEVWELSASDDFPDYASARGGTDFRIVFEWIEKNILDVGDEVECLLFFTDGYGPFPDEAPEYPVMFIDFGGVEYPFGDVIPLQQAII